MIRTFDAQCSSSSYSFVTLTEYSSVSSSSSLYLASFGDGQNWISREHGKEEEFKDEWMVEHEWTSVVSLCNYLQLMVPNHNWDAYGYEYHLTIKYSNYPEHFHSVFGEALNVSELVKHAVREFHLGLCHKKWDKG